MKKILFVCLGNICRSPGAEAIMKAWIKKEGKEKEFLIDSAGLYSGHALNFLDLFCTGNEFFVFLICELVLCTLNCLEKEVTVVCAVLNHWIVFV